MKKLFISLVALAMVIVSQGQAQAQPGIIGIHGYGGLPYGTWLSCNQWLNWFPWLTNYPWLTVPGCEAQMVVRQNQAMLAGFAQQAIQPTTWPYPGWPGAPQPQQPQPALFQAPTGQQYIIVRVPKGWEKKVVKIGAWSGVGAAIGGTIAKIARADVSDAVLLGLLGGGSGGLLETLDDYDFYAVPVPPPQPPTQQPSPQSQLPAQQPQVSPQAQPAPTRVVALITLSGIPMVIVNESEFWIHVEKETTGEGFVILGPKTEAPDLTAPQGRLRFYVITPENGVMTRREIVPEPDPTLPGWRIPSEPRER